MKKAIIIAVTRLSTLKFFPPSATAQAEIVVLLERMVSSEQQLQWLVETLLGHVDEWPGLRSVRGLFCTRYKPADGIEATCSLPGFTAEACEARAALEPARLLGGAHEKPMDADDLARFHDQLLKPLLRRSQPRLDREAVRRAEEEIAAWKPTLTEEEKSRRIREIEDNLVPGHTARNERSK